MSRRHEKLTTRGILSRVQRKRKRVEGAAVDAMSMQTVTSDGELRSNNREEEVENLWNCPEFETLSDDEDARENTWRLLSDESLVKLHFIQSTTQSKAAIKKYFDCHQSEDDVKMKILLINDGLMKVTCCSICTLELSECECEESEKCEIYFTDLHKNLYTMVKRFGRKIVQLHQNVMKNVTVKSPMENGRLRNMLLEERKNNYHTVHMHCSFDGIKLHSRGRLKVWPFSTKLLDLNDIDRESPGSIILAAVFFGKSDPSSQIHDKIVKWIEHGFQESFEMNSVIFRFKITSCIHDDPARRKLYRMKSHSSKGACFYCLNQQTVIKINDSFTIIREHFDQKRHPNIVDGLQEGEHSYFQTLIPMWENPIDIFHTFEEGIFDKLIQLTLGDAKLPGFDNVKMMFLDGVRLPSRFRTMSRRIKEITGTEKSFIFESVLCPSAFSGRFAAVPSAVILAFHSLYRLNVDPCSIDDKDISTKAAAIARAITPFIARHFPDLIRGSKVHQILFHLSDNMTKFGALAPLSTKSFEHFYHTIQRQLCPEITNSLGFSLMRSVQLVQELQCEVTRRIEEETDPQLRSWNLKQLTEHLRIVHSSKRSTMYEVPSEFRAYSEVDDMYMKTMFIDGRRFSCESTNSTDDTNIMYRNEQGSMKYGKVLGFLVKNDETRRRLLINRFAVSDVHLEKLARNLIETGESKSEIQQLINSLCDPCFGGSVTQCDEILVIPDCCVVGHAVVVKIDDSVHIIIPFAFRVSLS